MAAKFIVSIDRRFDVQGIPIQFYAVEITDGSRPPTILKSSLFSAVEAVTVDEMASVFEYHARMLRQFADAEESTVWMARGNESVN
jgi:hypothetical protein